jgi:hypothetical protein
MHRIIRKVLRYFRSWPASPLAAFGRYLYALIYIWIFVIVCLVVVNSHLTKADNSELNHPTASLSSNRQLRIAFLPVLLEGRVKNHRSLHFGNKRSIDNRDGKRILQSRGEKTYARLVLTWKYQETESTT